MGNAVAVTNRYTIDCQDGITVIRFLKKPSFRELKEIVDILVDHYDYRKRLWDMSQIPFDLSLAEIQQISDYGKQKFKQPNKLAMVVRDELVYGQMRQFSAYRNEHGKAIPGVFWDLKEAISWLKE